MILFRLKSFASKFLQKSFVKKYKNCFKIFFLSPVYFSEDSPVELYLHSKEETTQNGDNLYIYNIGEVIIMCLWGVLKLNCSFMTTTHGWFSIVDLLECLFILVMCVIIGMEKSWQ